MARFKTFRHGGLFSPHDVNQLTADILNSLKPWRTIKTVGSYSKDPFSGTHRLGPGQILMLGSNQSSVPIQFANGMWETDPVGYSLPWMTFLDPQSYGGRLGRLRWRIQLACNDTPFGANLTFGLFGASSVVHAQTSGAVISRSTTTSEAPPPGNGNNDEIYGWPRLQGVAVSVPGSGFAVAAPPPGAQGSLSVSTVMSMPAQAQYMIGVTANTAPAANSDLLIRADLQFRTERYQ